MKCKKLPFNFQIKLIIKQPKDANAKKRTYTQKVENSINTSYLHRNKDTYKSSTNTSWKYCKKRKNLQVYYLPPKCLWKAP